MTTTSTSSPGQVVGDQARPSTEIVPHQPASAPIVPARVAPAQLSAEAALFVTQQRMAKLFALSGCFADVKGQSEEQAIAKAYVKIALGASMGFSPAESMSGIDLIQGKPAIGAHLRATRMRAAGYRWTIDKLDATGCELTIYRGDEQLGRVVFTMADAKRMGLAGKDNWTKQPEDMLFARTITRAQRRYAPEALGAYVMDPDEARAAIESDRAAASAPAQQQPAGEQASGPRGGVAELEASLSQAEQGEAAAEREPGEDEDSSLFGGDGKGGAE